MGTMLFKNFNHRLKKDDFTPSLRRLRFCLDISMPMDEGDSTAELPAYAPLTSAQGIASAFVVAPLQVSPASVHVKLSGASPELPCASSAYDPLG